MSAKVKPWLVLAVIFVAGILTGAALTIGLGAHFMHPPGPRDMNRFWMAKLTRDLNLTPDQQSKIEPILADAATKIQSLHRDEVVRGSQIFKAANDQIAALLTPEQKVELQKIESDREKRFSEHLRPWGPPHEGPDEMRPPGPPDGMMPPPTAPDTQTNAVPARP
jgi:Spy/CpxP family protein refolding chaperone